MNDIPRQVPAFEHGRLRIWSFDGKSKTGRALIEALSAEPRNPGPVQEALGAIRLDPYWLDLVRTSDIAELGLPGYLKQGYDVPQEQLEGASLATDADHVLIAPSRAFADTEQTLSPDPALRPLATLDLHEDVGSLRPMDPVETARPDRGTGPERSETQAGPPAGRNLRPGAILILVIIAAAFIAMVAF